MHLRTTSKRVFKYISGYNVNSNQSWLESNPLSKQINKPGVVAQACNPSTVEAEAGRLAKL